MSACLDIRRLSAVLPNGQRVLRSVSLSVQPGEVRALVGESGAGKTMIGKAVLGVLPKSVRIVEGEMLIEGEDLGRLEARVRQAVDVWRERGRCRARMRARMTSSAGSLLGRLPLAAGGEASVLRLKMDNNPMRGSLASLGFGGLCDAPFKAFASGAQAAC